MATRQQFTQLLAAGQHHVAFNEISQHPEEYSQYAVVESMDGAYVDEMSVVGFGNMRKKKEGANIQYDELIEGGSQRYEPDAFALGWKVTKEMREDDRYGIMRKAPQSFGRSVHEKIETVAIQPLNLGFSTQTTADGVSFFNTAHPLAGGGTYGNRPAVDASLSVTTLQDAIVNQENLVDERGLKLRLSPDKLWIPPAQQFLAQKTLQSQMDPESGNRSINPIYGRFEICMLHYLSDATDWFVSSTSYNYLRFFWRTKPEYDSTDDFEVKGTKHSVYLRVVSGVTDWRGWYGVSP